MWHTYGRCPTGATSLAKRRVPPPEARQRGEHQGLLPFRSRRKIDAPVWSAERGTRRPDGRRPR